MSIPPVTPVQASTSSTHAPLRTPVPSRLPAAPTPVTPAVAAVHIMKVPASRLVEGFASLQTAIDQQARVQASQEHAPVEEYAAVEATRPAPLEAASPAPPPRPVAEVVGPAPPRKIDLRA